MPNVNGVVLTERDRVLLCYIGVARYASAEQLHRLFFDGCSKKQTYRRLAKLCTPGGRPGEGAYLRRLEFRRREGTGVPVWALTPFGRSVASPLVPWLRPPAASDVGARFLEHTLLLNDGRAGTGGDCSRRPVIREARRAVAETWPQQGSFGWAAGRPSGPEGAGYDCAPGGPPQPQRTAAVEANAPVLVGGQVASRPAGEPGRGEETVRSASGLGMIMEATIREVVRQEVSAALRERLGSPGLATRASWMTPPAAARQVGISEKAVRMMIKRGTLTTRLRNVEVDPRQPKYLVNVDEVAAAAQRVPSAPGKATAGPPDLVEQAVRIRAKRAGR